MRTFCRILLILLAATSVAACDGEGAGGGDEASPKDSREVCDVDRFAGLVETNGDSAQEVVDGVVEQRSDAVEAEPLGEGDREGDDGTMDQRFVLLDAAGKDIGVLSVGSAPNGRYTGFLALCTLDGTAGAASASCSTEGSPSEKVRGRELDEQAVLAKGLVHADAARSERIDEEQLPNRDIRRRYLLISEAGEPLGSLAIDEDDRGRFTGWFTRCAG